MGKSPDEIERDIRQRRDSIAKRITAVQTRLQDDFESLRAEVSQRAGDGSGDATLARLPGELGDQVDRHPLTMLAGAFGAGVVLGIATDPGGDAVPARNGRHAGRANGNGRSFMGGMADSILEAAGGTLQDELRQIVRDGISSLAGARGAGSEPASAH